MSRIGVEEQLVGEAPARFVFGAAVDDLLEDDVPVRVVGEVGVGDDSLEIAAVPVDVAADDQRTGRRQTDRDCHVETCLSDWPESLY